EDVIFSGTRDRKPNGMAEVSLSLIDPEVYEGADAGAPTEVEIQEEMPTDDWDEAEIRSRSAEETERLTEEARPGVSEESESNERSSRHPRGSRRHHQVQDQEAAGGSPARRIQTESLPRERHFRGSHAPDELPQASGIKS